MFERFTEKAIKVIMLAQEESRRLGHNFVGTEQILLGLIGERTGTAAIMLRNCGVTLKAARTEVEKIIGRGSGFVAVEIPFTPRAKKLLELSWGQARHLGDNFIDTEHLLMGLVAEGSGVAMKVLENLSADLTGISAQVLYLRSETANQLREPFFNRAIGRLFGMRTLPDILSTSADKVLQLAQSNAREAGRRCVGSDQLLLAILLDGDSVAANVLIENGVTVTEARNQSDQIAGFGPGDLGEVLNNTPRTDRIIALAHAEAHRLKKSETEVEHLLLGLLKENAGVGIQVLLNTGVNCDRIRAMLLQKCTG